MANAVTAAMRLELDKGSLPSLKQGFGQAMSAAEQLGASFDKVGESLVQITNLQKLYLAATLKASGAGAEGWREQLVSLQDIANEIDTVIQGYGGFSSAAKDAFNDLEQELNDAEDGIRDFGSVLDGVENKIQSIGDAGATIGNIGADMLSPLQNATDMYIQKYGVMTSSSIRWAQTNERIERTYARMGATAMEALQPMQEQLLKILTVVADLIEKNPQMVQGFAAVGGTLVGVGSAMNVLSQVGSNLASLARIASSLKGLGGVGGMAGGLGGGAGGLAGSAGMLGSAALYGGVGIGALALGSGIGMGVGKGISGAATGAGLMSKEYNAAVQGQKLGDVLGMLVKLIRTGLLGAISGLIKVFLEGGRVASKLFVGLGELVGTIPGMASSGIGYTKEGAQSARENAQRNYEDASEQLSEFMKEGLLEVWASPEAAEQYRRNRDGTTAGGNSMALSQSEMLSQDMVMQYESMLRQMANDQENFAYDMQQQNAEFARQELINRQQFNRQMKQAEDDFQYDRGIAAQEYAIQRRDAYRDFNIQRGIATDEFNRSEMLRLVQFNRDRERAERDHRYAIQDAAARLDALAVINEQRQFTREKAQAKKDFDFETKQNVEQFKRQQSLEDAQFARQIADMQRNYARQEQLAAEQFARQQARAQSDFKYQENLARQDFAYRQSMAQQQFNRQQQMQLKQYQWEVQTQLRQYTWEEGALAAHYNNIRASMAKFLNMNLSTPPPSGGSGIQSAPQLMSGTGSGKGQKRQNYTNSAVGGYTQGGLTMLHDGEFVLTKGTTQMLEQMGGGRLTQSGIASMMGGGVQAGITNNFYDVGSYTQPVLEGMVERATTKSLTNILRKYKGE